MVGPRPSTIAMSVAATPPADEVPLFDGQPREAERPTFTPSLGCTVQHLVGDRVRIEGDAITDGRMGGHHWTVEEVICRFFHSGCEVKYRISRATDGNIEYRHASEGRLVKA